MKRYIDDFLQSLESVNSQKTLRTLLNKIDFDNIDINTVNELDLQEIVIEARPNSEKAITALLHALKKYTEWLNETGKIKNRIPDLIKRMNRTELWNLVPKDKIKKKFISYQEYKDWVQDIGQVEDYNILYYQTLVMAIYEGIYSDDRMTVLKNLRGSDVDVENNSVVLHRDDGQTYKMKVSTKLAENLVEISEMDTWERINGRGLCVVKLMGLYPDSCFKKENRNKNNENEYFNTYYNRIERISKSCLGRLVNPQEIYISGIMHKMNVIFKKHGIDIREAFQKLSRDTRTTQLMERVLISSNYVYPMGSFREIVQSYIDTFVE